MMIMTTGTGICGYLDWSEDEKREDDRRREAERKREAEEASAAADMQRTLDRIDAALAPHLKDELAAVNKSGRVTENQKKDFANFKEYIETKWRLPALPASPQAVAVFLAEESEHGATHVSRLANSISTVHRALNFSDSCEDVLVRAILRQVRSENKATPEKGN
jgi:hypothetical protein